MATQRVIPCEEDFAAPKVINIDSNLIPSSGGCFILGSGQQGVTFNNNSGGTITITFVNNPISGTVFVNSANPTNPGAFTIATGNNLTLTPPANLTGATVNYYISAGVVNNEPYAIQIGAGPMYVQISSGAVAVLCNPATVAIPFSASTGGGTLELVATDHTYPVGPTAFSNNFYNSSQQQYLTSVAQGLANNYAYAALSAAVSQYNYTISPPGPSPILIGPGGGKIIIHA